MPKPGALSGTARRPELGLTKRLGDHGAAVDVGRLVEPYSTHLRSPLTERVRQVRFHCLSHRRGVLLLERRAFAATISTLTGRLLAAPPQ